MKFAIISDSQFNGKIATGMNGNIFDWAVLFKGWHFWIHDVKKDFSRLDEFDVILMVDVSRWFVLAIEMMEVAKKPKYVFYPEGGEDVYFRGTFEEQRYGCEIFRRVNLIGCADEDWIEFYNTLFGNKAFFMHVPTPDFISNCTYWRDWQSKTDDVLLCCNLGMDWDRSKTNLLKSVAAIKKAKVNCMMVEIPESHASFISGFFGINTKISRRVDMKTYADRFVARSLCLLNLSDIIGTSRNAIVGAGCGTPVIGNIKSHTQRRLFPDLAVDPIDTKKISELIRKLISDKEYYAHACIQAREKLPYYSMENALHRVNEAVKSKGVIIV